MVTPFSVLTFRGPNRPQSAPMKQSTPETGTTAKVPMPSGWVHPILPANKRATYDRVRDIATER